MDKALCRAHFSWGFTRAKIIKKWLIQPNWKSGLAMGFPKLTPLN